MRTEAFDREAKRLSDQLPAGRRLGVLGSTSFWHQDSAAFCAELGNELAKLQFLVIVTGGMPGVATAVGNAFCQAHGANAARAAVVHVLPFGHRAPELGSTHFAGHSLPHRREILARLAMVYVMVEGGPGTAEEAAIARSRGARIIPVAALGGEAGTWHARNSRPEWAPEQHWQELNASSSHAGKLAQAVFCLVGLALSAQGGA